MSIFDLLDNEIQTTDLDAHFTLSLSYVSSNGNSHCYELPISSFKALEPQFADSMFELCKRGQERKSPEKIGVYLRGGKLYVYSNQLSKRKNHTFECFRMMDNWQGEERGKLQFNLNKEEEKEYNLTNSIGVTSKMAKENGLDDEIRLMIVGERVKQSLEKEAAKEERVAKAKKENKRLSPAERVAANRAARKAKEEQARLEAEQAEKERLAKEQEAKEAERLEQERLEQERLEAEKAEQERLEAKVDGLPDSALDKNANKPVEETTGG